MDAAKHSPQHLPNNCPRGALVTIEQGGALWDFFVAEVRKGPGFDAPLVWRGTVRHETRAQAKAEAGNWLLGAEGRGTVAAAQAWRCSDSFGRAFMIAVDGAGAWYCKERARGKWGAWRPSAAPTEIPGDPLDPSRIKLPQPAGCA